MAPGAASVSLGLPALALALVALLVWRRHRPGWRAAHDGDWAGTLEVGGETSPALSRGDADRDVLTDFRGGSVTGPRT
jgi:hypothetical protein